MTTPEPAPAYLDPLHDELDRLRNEVDALEQQRDNWCATARDEQVLANAAEKRAELAEARVNELLTTLDEERAFHKLRSDAVNRVGATNDTLRATLARVEKSLDGMF